MRKRNGLPELQIWGGSSNAIFSKCKDTTSIAISKINLKKMNIEQFQQLLNEKRAEIEQALRRTLPIKVGRIAKDHFQEGFRQGGLQDNGTQAWQRKKRPGKYGPLMSSRQNLYGSIYYHPDDYRVTVGTSVPYAEIHNEGGIVISRKTEASEKSNKNVSNRRFMSVSCFDDLSASCRNWFCKTVFLRVTICVEVK